MNTTRPGSRTLHLNLLGIPVHIHPLSWIVLAILGGGLGISDRDGLVHTLLFVAAGMLALIGHEMGHALTARRLGGGHPNILIAGIGGVTYTPVLPPTRLGYAAMVAAGPLAGFALGALTGLALGALLGCPAAGLKAAFLLPLPISLPGEESVIIALRAGMLAHALPQVVLHFFLLLMQICFWWSVFNLLPIFPLDGGKLLGTLLHNDRLACGIGLGTSLLLVALSIATQSWFNIMLTGYLAYINYQCLRSVGR
ncbi:MAG: site-2 protease family protein [Akkermansia sp.]